MGPFHNFSDKGLFLQERKHDSSVKNQGSGGMAPMVLDQVWVKNHGKQLSEQISYFYCSNQQHIAKDFWHKEKLKSWGKGKTA